MYKCECGKEFETRQSLNSHARFCKLYKKVPKKISKYKIEDNLYRCECGREFDNFQSLNGHLSHCDIHCNCLYKKRNDKHKGTMNWEGKTDEEIKEIRRKAGQTLHEKCASGEIIPSFKGKHHSKEHKQKLRE